MRLDGGRRASSVAEQMTERPAKNDQCRESAKKRLVNDQKIHSLQWTEEARGR